MANDLHTGYQTGVCHRRAFRGGCPGRRRVDANAILGGTATDDPAHGAKPGQMNLWDKDNKHPSIQGSYLAALVLFEQITGTDARQLGAEELAARDLGISRE